MYQSCPISLKHVDTHIVRLVAFQITVSTVAFLVTHEGFFLYLICLDFIFRGMRKNQFSPFYVISNQIIAWGQIAPKWSDESPKRFALYLGLVVSLCMLLAFQFGHNGVVMAISVVLLICTTLETMFDFCIGCKLYFAIQFLKAGAINDRNFK